MEFKLYQLGTKATIEVECIADGRTFIVDPDTNLGDQMNSVLPVLPRDVLMTPLPTMPVGVNQFDVDTTPHGRLDISLARLSSNLVVVRIGSVELHVFATTSDIEQGEINVDDPDHKTAS